MSNHCFSFLEEDFPNIALECESCEKHLVEGNYSDSVIHAGKSCELITKEIAINIGKPDLNLMDQNDRLNSLIYNLMVIPDRFNRSFHKIRRNRNYAIHDELNDPENTSYYVHRRLFEICVWFYKDYGANDFTPPEYAGPIYTSNKIDKEELDDKIDGIIDKKLDGVSKKVEKHYENTQKELSAIKDKFDELEKQAQEITEKEKEYLNDNLKDYPFKTNNGSYLLNELSKLNISSGEAVESENNLNQFKSYIHVDRSIQEEFIEELERVVNEDSSHLVMLCGSVGDGKSHLLAYLKTNRPDLYNRFRIHSDATESHFTQKNAEDTLAEVLTAFDDENFDDSYEKFILAINLGVLNNFLESDYCAQRYTKLKNIVEKAHIFDSDIISQNIIQDKVSFITFSDYNLFELNGDYDSNYVSSKYISALIDKITVNDYDNNPFYRAYMMDCDLGYINPILYNYEMLCDEEVQKVIIEHIIRIFVENKKIISTRDLLNLIYELVVPPILIKYSSNDTVADFIDELLPNLLFDNADRSDLLYLLSQHDPTLIRSKNLDLFMMDFNISYDLSEILNEYFNTSKLSFLDNYFKEYEDLSDCSISEKQKLITTLIRFALFYGKSNFKNNFVDDNYLEFLKYLYAYNIQNNSQYQKLFLEVKKAIFNLKGSVKKDYICIDELDSFKVSKELKLKYYTDSFDVAFEESLANRFKTSIKVFFSVPPYKNKISLEVDYPLYSAICKLNNGYKPNKVERENLVLFEEFINNLVDENPSDDLIIRNVNVDADFTFEYNEDFDSFTFERGG